MISFGETLESLYHHKPCDASRRLDDAERKRGMKRPFERPFVLIDDDLYDLPSNYPHRPSFTRADYIALLFRRLTDETFNVEF